ncbi:uncharacterized protein DEA37_0001427 [Paragonimus westermani]|uniref:Uncharacterized protein n=1 Tax=Paragonimus westermani TaxID=34504 RepID=A0A5J4NS08_9TREM|nr:uncharacterized protein DEA37_0001427 [Paragonimus westermani]
MSVEVAYSARGSWEDLTIEAASSRLFLAAELSAQAGGWAGKDAGSRLQLINRIQAFVPAQTMLPPRRLEELIEESVRSQLSTCIFHNPPLGSTIDLDSVSLLQRHSCGM